MRAERKGAEKKGVPEELFPELCRLLARSGADGIIKVQDKFTAMYPNISKRQVELEAQKMAVKEKQGRDTMRMWHIRPEFQHMLEEGDAGEEEEEESVEEETSKTPKSGGKKRPSGSITDFMTAKTPGSSSKRKLASSSSSSSSSTPGDNQSPPMSGGETDQKKKNKAKTAFQLYVKDKRGEAETMLGEAAVDTDVLKQRLLEMWRALGDIDRKPYLKMEADAKAKFERASATASATASASGKKKAKR